MMEKYDSNFKDERRKFEEDTATLLVGRTVHDFVQVLLKSEEMRTKRHEADRRGELIESKEEREAAEATEK